MVRKRLWSESGAVEISEVDKFQKMALGVGQERGDGDVETGVGKEFRMQGTSS